MFDLWNKKLWQKNMIFWSITTSLFYLEIFSYTSQPPKTVKNNRCLLSRFFLKIIFKHILATKKYSKIKKFMQI